MKRIKPSQAVLFRKVSRCFDDVTADMDKLEFTQSISVKYQVEGTSYRYLILTTSQNVNTNDWELNGQPSMANLGFMPAFRASPTGGQLVYTRFYRIYLPSYLVSLTAALLMLGYYFKRSLPPPS